MEQTLQKLWIWHVTGFYEFNDNLYGIDEANKLYFINNSNKIIELSEDVDWTSLACSYKSNINNNIILYGINTNGDLYKIINDDNKIPTKIESDIKWKYVCGVAYTNDTAFAYGISENNSLYAINNETISRISIYNDCEKVYGYSYYGNLNHNAFAIQNGYLYRLNGTTMIQIATDLSPESGWTDIFCIYNTVNLFVGIHNNKLYIGNAQGENLTELTVNDNASDVEWIGYGTCTSDSTYTHIPWLFVIRNGYLYRYNYHNYDSSVLSQELELVDDESGWTQINYNFAVRGRIFISI